MKNSKLYQDKPVQRIAFVHHKGGTGKTTSCLNIAGWLNKLGKKVLVLDVDPQGNATTGLGVDLQSLDLTLSDVLFDQASVEETLLETHSGVYLAPAHLDLREAEIQLARLARPSVFLRDKLSGLDRHFDYILIDAPPGSGLLMINSIVAAENLIIPMDSGIFGYETLESLKSLLQELQRKEGIEITILMALLKNFSASIFDGGFTRSIKQWVQEFFALNELDAFRVCTVPFSKKIFQAQHRGLPISHYAPLAKVGRVYRRIAKELMERN